MTPETTPKLTAETIWAMAIGYPSAPAIRKNVFGLFRGEEINQGMRSAHGAPVVRSGIIAPTVLQDQSGVPTPTRLTSK